MSKITAMKRLSVTLAALFLFTTPAHAVTVIDSTWNQEVSNDYSDPPNWDPELSIPPVNQLLGFLQFQQEGRHGRSREVRRAA